MMSRASITTTDSSFTTTKFQGVIAGRNFRSPHLFRGAAPWNYSSERSFCGQRDHWFQRNATPSPKILLWRKSDGDVEERPRKPDWCVLKMWNLTRGSNFWIKNLITFPQRLISTPSPIPRQLSPLHSTLGRYLCSSVTLRFHTQVLHQVPLPRPAVELFCRSRLTASMGMPFKTYLTSRRVWSCNNCSAHLANHEVIVSKVISTVPLLGRELSARNPVGLSVSAKHLC